MDKFFLALDYATDDEIFERGMVALRRLEEELGEHSVRERFGVKINEDAVSGPIDGRLKRFKHDKGCSIFVDFKSGHGYDTGKRILDRVLAHLPIDYVTVGTHLGVEILREYVEIGKERGIKIIAWTVHTKTSPQDAMAVYRRPLADSMYDLAVIASQAGCHAVVMEGAMLRHRRIRALPIRKLVTGIRIDPLDLGTQKRATALEELAILKHDVDYAVVSSRNVSDCESLIQLVRQLM